MRRFAFAVFAALAGCTYDPPPEVALKQPPKGVFEVGDPLTLSFTEPVRPETFGIRIWPAGPEAHSLENELLPGVAPALDVCRPETSPCGEATLALAEDRLSATLALGGQAFSKVKVPWRLEVLTGLADDAGRETGAPAWFDFQFQPGPPKGGDVVAFDDGIYFLNATIDEPLPAVLLLLIDLHVLPDGRVRWAAGKAVANDGLPKNTANPAEVHIDTTEKGFAIFPTGSLAADGDERFMKIDPFDLVVRIGPLHITLSELRISGVVRKDPATSTDAIEGTISFSGITLTSGCSEPFHYDAGNTSFFAVKVADGEVPAGVPSLCGDPCGAVTTQCEPPGDLTTDGFCEGEAP